MSMNKKYVFIYLLVLIMSGGLSKAVFSQQDAQFSQYMFNTMAINPGYAGSADLLNASVLFRAQWVGFDGAPFTGIAAVDGPIKTKNMGLGMILMHDRIGVTKQNTAMFNYAYELKTSATSKLAFGINAGISQFSANLTQLLIWDTQDQVFQNDLTSKILPRMGLGMYYFGEKHYIGLSVPTLIAYQKGMDFSIDLSKSSFLRRHYLLTAGYVFDTDKDIKIKPSVLLKYVNMVMIIL